MSSSTTTAKPSVSEIQKVYVLVDERKDVNALKECDAMLQKYPESSVFLSFKALILMNLGKRKESIQLVDDVLAQKKMDFHDFILRTLSMALEKVHDYKRIAELYEKVYNAIPAQSLNQFEDLIEKYFYSLVRSNQTEKQQTTAVKLSRTFPDNQLYNYWNICSMLLLGKNKPLLFKLASKMLEKEFALDTKDVKKLEGVNYSERLRLYIESVLDATGDYEGIINLLYSDEPWGKELEPLPFDRKAILAGYCLKVEKYYTLANGIYTYLLDKEDSDEWPWWLGVIQSTLLITQTGQANTTSLEWEGKTLNCYTSVEELHKLTRSHQNKDKRGPYLAELELMKVLKQKDMNQYKFDKEAGELIINYFKTFGSRKICYDDLKVYLELVADQAQLLSQIYSSIDSLKVNPLDKIEYQTTFFKIQRHTKQNVCCATEDELISTLISNYAEALPLGKNLHETDSQYGDEFLLIAAHYLMDRKEFVSAVTLLELALKRSKYNFHFKVLLIRAYAAMKSLSSRAFTIFLNDLDIKHIQYESISYLIYHDLMSVGVFDKATKVAEKILKFFDSEHRIYTSQYLAMPYQKQSWSKIGEMTNFSSRLDHSYSIGKAQIDKLYLKLVFEDVHSARDVSEQLNMIDLDDFIYNKVKSSGKPFSFNEDTSILKYFGSEDLKNNILIPKELSERPSLDESFAKLRIVEILSDFVTNKEIALSKPPVQIVNPKKKKSEKETLEFAAKLKDHERKVETAKKTLLKLKEKAEILLKQIDGSNIPAYCTQIINYIISIVSDETPKIELLENFIASFESLDFLQHKDNLPLITHDIVYGITFFQLIYSLLKDLGTKADKRYSANILKLKSTLLQKATQIDTFIKESRKTSQTFSENTSISHFFKSLSSYDWETVEKEVLLDLNNQVHKGGFLNTKVEQIVGNMIFQYSK